MLGALSAIHPAFDSSAARWAVARLLWLGWGEEGSPLSVLSRDLIAAVLDAVDWGAHLADARRRNQAALCVTGRAVKLWSSS